VNLVEYQIGNLLNMVARGTPGGSRRADGSEIERGVHLRWQVAPELGFPSGGFDIYRRVENNGHYWRCGAFRQADVVGAAWLPHDDDHLRPGVTLKFPGKVVIAAGCRPGATNAASFPGEREVRLNFEQPVRVVRIVFHGNTAGNPTAEAYSLSSEGPVLLARQRARKRGGQRILTLHANPTDYVVLRGTAMILCELCFVLLREGRDRFWPDTPLNGNTPIYLPITHPVWDSPHRHTPDDQAEARSRLPAGLLQETRTAYVAGFRDDLHAILYDLVGTDPQRLYRLRNADQRSAATLDWPGMNLVQLLALDPNLARVLGLYWHDEPPSADAYFDYRVIAHYGDASYPGLGIDFARLEPGRRFGPTTNVRFAEPGRGLEHDLGRVSAFRTSLRPRTRSRSHCDHAAGANRATPFRDAAPRNRGRDLSECLSRPHADGVADQDGRRGNHALRAPLGHRHHPPVSTGRCGSRVHRDAREH